MKLVIISTFWNSGKLTEKCINSLKSQYYTNFVAYFIDDMSSDNTYNMTKNAIGNDNRFILIKNTEKKYKTKNFVDTIKDNPRIDWDDVIIELDGDDSLADNFVLGRLNKIYMDNNIWVCGSRWKDQFNKLGNYGKPNLLNVRKTSWNFSHLRTFRSFLFRLIDNEDLKFNGEFFKAACDLGHGIPILEMCGNEHFYYIDEPLYIYNWHDTQSYSENTEFKDKTLQGKTAKYIYSLDSYPQVVITDEINVGILNKKNKLNKLSKIIPSNFNTKKEVSYDMINSRNTNKNIIKQPKLLKQNKPKNRNDLIQMKKSSIVNEVLKLGDYKNKKKNKNRGIF